MQRTLYSGHLSIADIIFRNQFKIPFRTDLSIADTPNNKPCKTFLARNLYKFYLRQCFTVSLKLSLLFVILFFGQFNDLFGPQKWKFTAFSSPYSPPWLVHFPVGKMSKTQLGRIRDMDTIMKISVAYGQPLFFIVRILANHSNCIFVHFLGWFFLAMQTLANQWLPTYHINIISSNILSLGSFFFQHQPLDTLLGRLHYTLTLQRKLLKQVWEETLCVELVQKVFWDFTSQLGSFNSFISD